MDKNTHCWVICNGPSSESWRGYEFKGAVIGCNMGFRDWPVTDIVAVDRMTVHEIRVELKDTYTFQPWTRTSTLALPPAWLAAQPPGIDSGSLAVKIALDKATNVTVIGADGVLAGVRETRYQYRWHPKGPPSHIYQRHRRAMTELIAKHPHRITWVWPTPVEGFTCVTREESQAYHK